MEDETLVEAVRLRNIVYDVSCITYRNNDKNAPGEQLPKSPLNFNVAVVGCALRSSWPSSKVASATVFGFVLSK